MDCAMDAFSIGMHTIFLFGIFIPDRVVIRLLHRYCSENILYKKSIDVLSDREKENAIPARKIAATDGKDINPH